MKITVDFNDGAYLLVDDNGNYVIYEDNEVDFEGTIKDTLKVIPVTKKQEIMNWLLNVNMLHLGVGNDKDTRGIKAINWCG